MQLAGTALIAVRAGVAPAIPTLRRLCRVDDRIHPFLIPPCVPDTPINVNKS